MDRLSRLSITSPNGDIIMIIKLLVLLLGSQLTTSWAASELYDKLLTPTQCSGLARDQVDAKLADLDLRLKNHRIETTMRKHWYQKFEKDLDYYAKRPVPSKKDYKHLAQRMRRKQWKAIKDTLTARHFDKSINFLSTTCVVSTDCELSPEHLEKHYQLVKVKNGKTYDEYRVNWDKWWTVLTDYHEKYLTKILSNYGTTIDILAYREKVLKKSQTILLGCQI